MRERELGLPEPVEEWVGRAISHGVYQEDNLPSPDLLIKDHERFNFRSDVATHELGHNFFARSFGAVIKRFFYEGEGSLKGLVSFTLPKMDFLRRQMVLAIIAMGGKITAQNDFGSGSDMNQVENAARNTSLATGENRASFFSRIRGVASDNIRPVRGRLRWQGDELTFKIFRPQAQAV